MGVEIGGWVTILPSDFGNTFFSYGQGRPLASAKGGHSQPENSRFKFG